MNGYNEAYHQKHSSGGMMPKRDGKAICCNCGTLQDPLSRECQSCGSSSLCPEDEVVECSACQRMNPPDAKHCIHCKEAFEDGIEDGDDSNDGASEAQRINKWVEHREWVLFWGLLVDSQEMADKVLLAHNKRGWKCIQVWRQAGVIPNLPLGKLLWILLVTLITLGFVQYFVGPAFLFEKSKR